MVYFLVSLLTYFSYLVLKTRKALIILDKNKYDLGKYRKWLFSKNNFINFELLGLFLIIISFIYSSKVVGICTIILYMLLSLLEIRKNNDKFKFNKKNIKVIVFTLIVYIIIFTIIGIDYYNYQKGFIAYDRVNYYYPVIIILGYIHYFVIYLSALVSKLFKKKKSKVKKNHKLK